MLIIVLLYQFHPITRDATNHGVFIAISSFLSERLVASIETQENHEYSNERLQLVRKIF